MRWCPTPEQLMMLEEMYRGGLKTPNASQIQKMTAHLSLYGRIEGKNVFYWFQNHKARDRQKLRRKLLSQQLMYQQQLPCHHYLSPNDHLFHNHQLLQYSPSSSSSSALHQVGRVEDSSAKPMIMKCKWKVDVQERIKKLDTSSFLDNKSTWDHSDWMTDVGPTLPPYCFNRVPLKTLQLFPITTTTLKDNKLSPNSSQTLF